MGGPERYDAYTLMQQFRIDEAALGDALALYVDRPDYGFIWLAYADGKPVGCVAVSFGITTESGGLLASLRDLWIDPDYRRRGIGSALLATLHGRLDRLNVKRVEASGSPNAFLRALFTSRGYAEQNATTYVR